MRKQMFSVKSESTGDEVDQTSCSVAVISTPISLYTSMSLNFLTSAMIVSKTIGKSDSDCLFVLVEFVDFSVDQKFTPSLTLKLI